MTNYEILQVGYKRFKSENPDGTGKITVLEEKSARTSMSASDEESVIVKSLYRAVKKGLN